MNFLFLLVSGIRINRERNYSFNSINVYETSVRTNQVHCQPRKIMPQAENKSLWIAIGLFWEPIVVVITITVCFKVARLKMTGCMLLWWTLTESQGVRMLKKWSNRRSLVAWVCGEYQLGNSSASKGIRILLLLSWNWVKSRRSMKRSYS